MDEGLEEFDDEVDALTDEEWDEELLDNSEFVESPYEEVVYTAPVRRRRAGGLIAAGLLGVEQALYGVRRNEIVMVADADGMPEPDYEVNLTPDPRDSTVILHRHRR